MKKAIFSFLAITLFVHSAPALATETLDELYASKVIVPLVLNRERYPVYGDYIEKEIEKRLTAASQFTFSKRALDLGVAELEKLGPITLTGNKEGVALQTNKDEKDGEIDLEAIAPLLNLMAGIGVHAAILGEIFTQENTYGITFHLVNVRTLERLHTSQSLVQDKFSLESFSYAADQAFQDLVKSIPFDGTVIKREGYRVILDRGDHMAVGDIISAYTVEFSGGDIMLQETGEIELTQVEGRLAFGKVIVEKKPREVLQGNKFRIPALHPVNDPMAPGTDAQRDLAAKPEYVGPRRALGYVNLNLGASLVSVNSRTAGGAGPSQNLMYPGGNLSAELWLTKDLFFDLDFQMGITSVADGGSSLNSNINGLRAIFGYRLAFDSTAMTPVAAVKLGFARRQFKIDNSSDPNSFVTTNYSGILIGGAFLMPLNPRFGLGFDVHANLLNSVSESPLDSGKVLGASSFDLSVRALYKFNSVVDLEARVQLSHNSAEFDGLGTRPLPITSSTQTTTTAYLGLLYYF